ncbi:MAG: hypothetical protein ABMB14_15470 [Myxococcota bacterium]
MSEMALVVSGHGEVEACPILVRRISHELLGCFDLRVRRPIRKPESGLLKEDSDLLSRTLLRESRGAGAILVLVDSEDGAPCTDGPRLQRRCDAACCHVPVTAVLAYREFETWFLWDALNLFGRAPDFPPERRRDAKDWIRRQRRLGYNPVADSPGLAQLMDLERVAANSDSFGCSSTGSEP